ncbi:LysM peptidoglycan-binding domain-containing protein [Chryseobacterium viscerum]|uniref:LysM peptidoglycan-binding domain-containing protein n=1 Tax=Chryseobacterium viscerum TaxID=1037377 RepID=A0A5N4BKF0_9FLAO|nr:LysM domain-containing protein [Chryseobacterium viscerum]KAB1228890.1 LysM peptidoglycan-binding domain-containing protein [Chryseobacterium viscerum]
MQKYNIHTVQKDETLKSIAALYNLDTDALKLFHNNLCTVKDMILINLNGQKELFIPRTAVTDKSRLVKFGRGNSLILQPAGSVRKYSVVITIEKGESKSELKYETSVRWLKKEKGLHFFEIDRTSNLYLNEEEVNEIADLLAYRTSKVLYPLQISTDENGKFEAVENAEVFVKRWSGIKEELYKEFDGETVDEYCRKIERVISEPEAIDLYLKNDYFIRALFFGVHQSFGQDYRSEMTTTFPVVDNAIEPRYKMTLETDPVKGETGLISIEGSGKLNDERDIDDFIRRSPFSLIVEDEPVINEEGSFRIISYMKEENALPESLYLECTIMLQEEKKISISVSGIDEN